MIGTIGAAKKVLTLKKVGYYKLVEAVKLFGFAMNGVNFWLAYQGITRTAGIQADFYNYLAVEMIDNTYDRFMIRHAEGRRRTIVDYDDDYIDDENPLFGQINGAPRCVIALHVTPTKKRRKKSDGTETKYLLQGG